MKLLKELVEARYSSGNRPEQTPTRTIRKIVRKSVEENGWQIWDSRTDKTTDGRRLAFWRNGWPVPKAMKQSIKDQVERDLQKGNLPGVVTWHKAESFRGSYDKLVVKVPREESNEFTTDQEKQKLRNELKRIYRKGLHRPGSPEYYRIREIQGLLGQQWALDQPI